MNYEHATVVSLGQNSSNVTVVSFEEAFGEYSNAKGKRQARKAARVAKRTEKRTARQQNKVNKVAARVATRDAKKRLKSETRQTRRNDRKTDRQQNRIGRRVERKEARQDMRDDQQQRRLGRRDERKMRRVARKEMGNQYDDYQDPNEMYGDQGYDDQGYDDYGYDDQGYDQGYDDQGYDDYGYEDDYGYDDQGYDDYDQGYGDDYDYDTDYDDYYDYQPEYYDDYGYGFDGTQASGDLFAAESVDQTIVPEEVLQRAVKIEWNKELVARLQDKGKAKVKANQPDDQVKIVLKKATERLSNLCDEERQYSEASGVRGRREVSKAKKIAREKRAQVSPDFRNKARTRKRRNVTPVESDLNPKLSEQRIEVPASEGMSGFSGAVLKEKVKNANWKGIAIGVAIGAAAIWALKKYKVV